MTLSEALLIDAIWWFDTNTNTPYYSEVEDLVYNIRADYGWKYSWDYEQEMYFNLLIREAIKYEPIPNKSPIK